MPRISKVFLFFFIIFVTWFMGTLHMLRLEQRTKMCREMPESLQCKE